MQEYQPTGVPSDNSRPQATDGSPSAGQSRVQRLQELSIVPGQTASTPEEHFQEPPETGETQLTPAPPTRPRSPGPSRTLSPAMQTWSGQAPAVTEGTEGQQSALDRENSGVSPDRHGSVTPTPRNPQNTTTPFDTPSPPPRDPQGWQGGPSRHGKGRRTVPYSDEEIGPDGGDVYMGDSPNFAPRQQRYEGVCFIFFLPFSHPHPPAEPSRD